MPPSRSPRTPIRQHHCQGYHYLVFHSSRSPLNPKPPSLKSRWSHARLGGSAGDRQTLSILLGIDLFSALPASSGFTQERCSPPCSVTLAMMCVETQGHTLRLKIYIIEVLVAMLLWELAGIRVDCSVGRDKQGYKTGARGACQGTNGFQSQVTFSQDGRTLPLHPVLSSCLERTMHRTQAEKAAQARRGSPPPVMPLDVGGACRAFAVFVWTGEMETWAR